MRAAIAGETDKMVTLVRGETDHYTCETGLVAGKIGYRPNPVDAPADGNVLICCSRPEGDVVIDL